jgi:hypothetical protein
VEQANAVLLLLSRSFRRAVYLLDCHHKAEIRWCYQGFERHAPKARVLGVEPYNTCSISGHKTARHFLAMGLHYGGKSPLFVVAKYTHRSVHCSSHPLPFYIACNRDFSSADFVFACQFCQLLQPARGPMMLIAAL